MAHINAVSCSGCGTPTHRRSEGIPLCKACDDDALALAKRLLADRDAEIARLKAAFDSESTLRAYRDEQLRLLHQDSAAFVRERNEARHEVETWQREYSGALADFEHAQAEIARLKAELAQERQRTGGYVPPVTPEAQDQRPATLDEIRTVMNNLDLQSRVDQRVPPIVVAPVDPRIDALCRVVEHLADRVWPGWCNDSTLPTDSINADLETIAGNR